MLGDDVELEESGGIDGSGLRVAGESDGLGDIGVGVGVGNGVVVVVVVVVGGNGVGDGVGDGVGPEGENDERENGGVQGLGRVQISSKFIGSHSAP